MSTGNWGFGFFGQVWSLILRRNSGAELAGRRRLNVVEGAGVSLTLADTPAQNEVRLTVGLSTPIAVASGGTGTGTVFTAASVIFAEAAGVYTQDAVNLTYDSTGHVLSVPTVHLSNITSGATVQVGDGVNTLLFRLYGPNVEYRTSGASANQTVTHSFYDNNDAVLKGRLLYAGSNSPTNRYFGFVNDGADALNFFTLNATPIGFWPNATLAWQFVSAGHLVTSTDNTYDIGSSAPIRPRSVYVGTSVELGGSAWVRGNPGKASLTADVTNTTTTFSNLTDLSITLVAGRKYTGRMSVRCSDSTAAEGVNFDFNGGSATMTLFNAGVTGNVQGAVAVTTTSAALATSLDFTAMNGTTDHWITLDISLVVNAGGTFIPRFAQNSHSTGTATAASGSYLWLEDSPN